MTKSNRNFVLPHTSFYHVGFQSWNKMGDSVFPICHAVQIVVNELVVNELIFKLLCSYRRENQAWKKEKEGEEEIRQCGLYNPSCLIQTKKRKHPKQVIMQMT